MTMPSTPLEWIALAAVAVGGLLFLFALMSLYFSKRDVRVKIIAKRKRGDSDAEAQPSHRAYAIDVEQQGKEYVYFCDRNMHYQLTENTTVTLTVKGNVIVGLHPDKQADHCELE